MTDRPQSEDDLSPQEIARRIAQEFRAHPEQWTQEVSARNRAAKEVTYDSPDANCWCLMGMCQRLSPNSHESRQELYKLIAQRLGITSLIEWNDERDRIVDDVIEICEAVANG